MKPSRPPTAVVSLMALCVVLRGVTFVGYSCHDPPHVLLTAMSVYIVHSAKWFIAGAAMQLGGMNVAG